MHILVFLLIFLVVILCVSHKTIPFNTVYIIERNGKYYRSAKNHAFLFPFIDKVKAEVNLNLCTIIIYLKDFHTINGAILKINTTINYLIKDPVKFTYEATNLYETIDELTRNLIKEIIKSWDSATIFHSKNIIIECLNKNIDKVFESFGCDLVHIKLNMRTIKSYNHSVQVHYHINNTSPNIPSMTQPNLNIDTIQEKLDSITNNSLNTSTTDSSNTNSPETGYIVELANEEDLLSTEPVSENDYLSPDDNDDSPITRY